MNLDRTVVDALARLGEPLPSEYSLADRVMERLDRQSPVSRTSWGWMMRVVGVGTGVAAGIVALAAAWFGVVAAPSIGRADVREAVAKQHWAHVTYDTGVEHWACLDDGREYWKSDAGATLRDPQQKIQLRYWKDDDRIIREPWEPLVLPGDEARKIRIPELDFSDIDARPPRRATEQERRDFPVFDDYEIETINGRRYGRIDHYVRDRIGEARLEKQTWVDLTTKLPWQRKDRMQVADQTKYKREFRTATFAFPTSGPKDIFDLGVPELTPVVDQSTIDAERKLANLPPDLARALVGAGTAIRKMPNDFRWIVDDADRRQMSLSYGSFPKEFVDAYVATTLDQGGPNIYSVKPPKVFQADHQDPTADPNDLSADLRLLLRTDPLAPLPEDAIAAWFPMEKSINVSLNDGDRQFHLTRFVSGEPGGSREERLHVSQASRPQPEPAEDLWPFFWSNRQYMTIIPPPGDTPKGQIVIQSDQPYFRFLWYCDPSRDFIAVRRRQWRKENGKLGDEEDVRAVRWKTLPGGLQVVTAWETRHLQRGQQVAASGKIEPYSEPAVDIRRVALTPLKPEDFPSKIFDGEAFLDAAKKAGAEIKTD
jgi:hypothetical protein